MQAARALFSEVLPPLATGCRILKHRHLETGIGGAACVLTTIGRGLLGGQTLAEGPSQRGQKVLEGGKLLSLGPV